MTTTRTNWQSLIEARFGNVFGSSTQITQDDDYIHISNRYSYIEVMCLDDNEYQILLCRNDGNHKQFKSITEDNPLGLTSAIAIGWEDTNNWEDEE